MVGRMVGLAVEVKLRFQIYTGVVWTGKGGGWGGWAHCMHSGLLKKVELGEFPSSCF